MKSNSTFYFNLSTVDNIGVGFFKSTLAGRGRFIIVNEALAHMLGYKTRSDLKQHALPSCFVSAQDRDRFFETIQKDNKVRFFETVFQKGNGESLWVAITASCVSSSNARVYIEGIIEDITAHREMEDNLAMEKDLLQSLLDNIPDAIYYKDGDSRITKVNKFYAQGVGLKAEEIIGKTDFDFFPYKYAREMFADDQRVIKTGVPLIGKVERTPLADGTWSQVMTTKIPMFDRKGNIIGTMGVTRDMTSYAHLEQERLQTVMKALDVISRALEMRDPYTSGHAQRVAYLAGIIGRELGWDEDRLLELRLAGELHDIGKIGIPQDLLTKPGRLTDIEYRLVQEHVGKSYQLLKDIEFPFPLAQIVCQHHERLDGSGYPAGLEGDQILPEARVLAISDVLEAMTYRRPYRDSLGLDKAVEELQSGAGTRYDRSMIDVVLQLIEAHDHTPFWLNS